VLALEPTVQVKVDTDGTPLTLPAVRPAITAEPELPAVRTHKTPVPAVRSHKTPIPSHPAARTHKTPIPGRMTPAAAFDAVEADFFAREADLYKRESVDTFDDLDPSGGGEKRSTTRRRRK
jgi:hypothetical protein